MPASRQVGGVDPVLLDACATTDAMTGLCGRGGLPGLRVNLSSTSTRDPCRPGIDEDVMDDEEDPLLDWLLPDRLVAAIIRGRPVDRRDRRGFWQLFVIGR